MLILCSLLLRFKWEGRAGKDQTEYAILLSRETGVKAHNCDHSQIHAGLVLALWVEFPIGHLHSECCP